MKTLKQLRGDQRGMTLVEVVTALVLFAVVFLILFYGINSALKVMNNANAINNATQSNASGLESLGTTLEQSQKATLKPLENPLSINSHKINGKFETATTAKSNDGTSMTLTLFQPLAPSATVPLPTLTAQPTTEKKVVLPDNSDITNPQAFVNDKSILVDEPYYLYQRDTKFSDNYFIQFNAKYTKTVKALYTGTFNCPGIFEETDANKQLLKQLYFNSDSPVNYDLESGDITFNLDLLYIGDASSQTNNSTITTNVKYEAKETAWPNYDINFVRANKMVLYGNSNDYTILYLVKPLILNGNSFMNWIPSGYSAPDDTSVTINLGYYKIPNGTDLLSAAYNSTEYDKYNKTVSEGGYKVNYSDIADYLTSIGVQTQ